MDNNKNQLVVEYNLPKFAFNKDELKALIEEKTEFYQNLVYSEDNAKDAKKDLADLRKMKNGLKDTVSNIRKTYMTPFDNFKLEVEVVSEKLDTTITEIDQKVKDFEEDRKAEKRKQIDTLFAENVTMPEIKLSDIWDDSWLNVSTSKLKIKKAMIAFEEKVKADLETIAVFKFVEESKKVYMDYSFDLNKAIAKENELLAFEKKIKEREEQERKRKAKEEQKVVTKKKSLKIEGAKPCFSPEPENPFSMAEDKTEGIEPSIFDFTKPEEKRTVQLNLALTLEPKQLNELLKYLSDHNISYVNLGTNNQKGA